MGLRVPSLGPLVTGIRQNDTDDKQKKKQVATEKKNKKTKEDLDPNTSDLTDENTIRRWTQIEYEMNDLVSHLPNVISLLEYAKNRSFEKDTNFKEKALRTYQNVEDIEGTNGLKGIRLTSKS